METDEVELIVSENEILKEQVRQLKKQLEEERQVKQKKDFKTKLEILYKSINQLMSKFKNIDTRLKELAKDPFNVGKLHDWYLWRELRNELLPLTKELHGKNYDTFFKEIGFKQDVDYKLITLEGNDFPTCVVNPESLNRMIKYLNITPTLILEQYLANIQDQINKLNELI